DRAVAAAAELFAKKAADPDTAPLLGEALLEAGRANEAIPLFECALAEKPRPDARRGLARALMHVKRCADALRTLDADDTREPEDLRLRGTILSAAGRPAAAVAAYANVIASGRHLDVAYFERGRALAAAKRHREALASFDAALGLDGTRSEVWQERGAVSLAMGRPRVALRSLERATDLAPEAASSWELRATALDALGRSEEAARCRARIRGAGPG
ncbi:MAG: tetratricopeptide repeat protein, partial [Chloroflexota bacterium]